MDRVNNNIPKRATPMRPSINLFSDVMGYADWLDNQGTHIFGN